MKRPIHILILLNILFCSSCKDDDFLDGYNRNELFAEPSQNELDDILMDWKSRDLSMKNYTVLQETEIPGINAVLKTVSYTVNGYHEYAALLVPESAGDMPVQMYIGGFGINNNVNSIQLVIDHYDDEPFVFALPALRGQAFNITINDIRFSSPGTSEGDHCDAFDGAADDVIALLNVIAGTEGGVNIKRTSVRGGSRGATVALLAAERDKRIKLAIGVAGPVNLLELTSLNENDQTYQCQFLNDLVNGNITVQSARLKMIASSPVFFAAHLGQTQLHLGKDDLIVPFSQGEDLKKVLDDLGMTDSLQLFIYEGRTHENIATNNPELNERINVFLKQL